MSEFEQSESRCRYARHSLILHRKLAEQVRWNEALHRDAMARVFSCEDNLFVLVQNHARLVEAQGP